MTTTKSLGGIEWFAFVCRHENEHRMNFVNWWPDGYNSAEDDDDDLIPNDREEEYECQYNNPNTHPHPKTTIDNPELYGPNEDYGDFEYVNYREHYIWYQQIKDMDLESVDWCWPGKQTPWSE